MIELMPLLSIKEGHISLVCITDIKDIMDYRYGRQLSYSINIVTKDDCLSYTADQLLIPFLIGIEPNYMLMSTQQKTALISSLYSTSFQF